jgi:tetratricopeptide (TPR) repeat protein
MVKLDHCKRIPIWIFKEWKVMSEKPQTPDSPFVIERLMRDARRSFEDEEFSSEADFRDKMHAVVDGDMPKNRMEALQDIPVELAQELAFQAFESSNEERAGELTEKAIAIDPDCVDALAIRAFLDSEDASQLIEALEHAATCGENNLGEDFFAEFMGDFWPMVEARPYMRAIKQLAEVLWAVGRRFDAVEHYVNLLDLDPEDHLGNSVLLLGCYLAMGEVQRSWDLIEEYDDESAIFQWGWVLVFLLSGDNDASEDALQHAMEINPHVAPHLLGMAERMENLPLVVTIGSPGEAQVCYQIIGEAWEHNPTAQMWLHGQLVQMGLIKLDEADSDKGDEPLH